MSCFLVKVEGVSRGIAVPYSMDSSFFQWPLHVLTFLIWFWYFQVFVFALKRIRKSQIWGLNVFSWVTCLQSIKWEKMSIPPILDEKSLIETLVCFIYILNSSNSSSFIFWTCQFASSSRCNWTGISTANSNGTWTDKESSNFSTYSKRDKCTSYILFHVTITTKFFWNDVEILLN